MTESIATRSIETNVLLQKAYPVSFRILNDKMEEKIYLEDQPSSGVFEISNDSGRALHFVPAHHGAIAGPDNYHFALKFRPGILKSDVKSLFKHKIIQKGWTLSIGLVSLETGEVVTLPPTNTGTPAQITQHLEESTTVLYFLNTSKASLAPGEKILLPLKQLRLQADEGTQVTQVELSCMNLAKDSAYTQVLQPHIRHFNLTLINHRGSPIMPIHVGFTGFNAILNDGVSENVLTLRITNQQKRTPQNKGTFTFSHDKHSRMYLYFETDSEKSDYALGTVDQVAGIGLDIVLPQQKEDKDKNTSHLVHEPMFQGDTPIWEIYPEYGDVVLQPHQTKLYPKAPSPLPDDSCLDIELSDIISDCYMGTTHLYLRLENIPGYWDQTYAIPILKQPLVFSVQYDLYVKLMYFNQEAIDLFKEVLSKNNIILENSVEKILFIGNASQQVRIKSFSSITEAENLKKQLVKLRKYDLNIDIEIKYGEYVGIGTTEPTNKLSVKGNADFNGNVGIGKEPHATNKLSVEGNADFGEKLFTKHLSVASDADFQGIVLIGTKTIGMDENPYNQESKHPRAMLQIENPHNTFHYNNNFGLFERTGVTRKYNEQLNQPTSFLRNSIYTRGSIMALQFIALSDERVKLISGSSQSAHDLSLLLKIKITDFTYIDSIAHGNRKHRKVIAQNLKKVYPQAVTLSAGEVPDIYKMATIKNGWVALVTDLKVDEKVLMIFENKKQVFEVKEIKENAFRIDTNEFGNVFVYGRQVDDFHHVDYDAVSMLNVSATQELAKQLDELKMENRQLKAELSELKKGLSTIQEMLGMKIKIEQHLRLYKTKKPHDTI